MTWYFAENTASRDDRHRMSTTIEHPTDNNTGSAIPRLKPRACAEKIPVIDLLRGGQGVFGVAIGGAIVELAGAVVGMQAFRAQPAIPAYAVEDELAERRKNRTKAG